MKLRAATIALASGAILAAVALNDHAQTVPLGHATDFTSSTYYEPPHDTQVKVRLSGAEASPLPGGALNVKQLRIEMFNVDGKLRAVAIAPECNYSPIERVASSSGHIEIKTGDGKIQIEGNGFLWQQDDNSLTISNNVHTTIKSGLLKFNGL